MRKLIYILAILTVTSAGAQVQATIFGDPAINTIGGRLNNRTAHNPVLAAGFKIAAKDRNNMYGALTYEYTNLAQKYNGLYIGLGFYIDGAEYYGVLSRFDFIVYLDAGLIQRELIPVDEFDKRNDPVSTTYGFNAITQYEVIDGWYIDFTANLRLRKDLPDKLFGFSGYIGITKDLIFKN